MSLWKIWALEGTRPALWGQSSISCPLCCARSSSQAHGEGRGRVTAAFSSGCSPATGEKRWPWNQRVLYFERNHLNNSTIDEGITPIMTLFKVLLSASHFPWWLFLFPPSKFSSFASNNLRSYLLSTHCFTVFIGVLLGFHIYFLTTFTIPECLWPHFDCEMRTHVNTRVCVHTYTFIYLQSGSIIMDLLYSNNFPFPSFICYSLWSFQL